MFTQAYYFDTNVLRQLSRGTANVEFIRLRDVARHGDDPTRKVLFVPSVVVKELTHHWIQDVHEEIESLDKASRNLGHMLARTVTYEQPQDVEGNVHRLVTEFLNSAEIEVIQIPNIPVESLVDMAVKKEAPFEEKREKGFRDAVIMFTILDHMERNQISNATLISADRIFNHEAVFKRFENRGFRLSVAKTVVEAKEQRMKEVDEAITTYIDGMERELKVFLSTKREQIFEFIHKNTRISESFLRGGGLFQPKDDLFGTVIKKILAYRPKEVSKVYLGLISTKEPVPQGFTGITFTVSLEIDLLIEDLRLTVFDQPTLALSSLDEFEKVRYSVPTGIEAQKTVVREITVEALLSKENGQYADLRIIKVLSY